MCKRKRASITVLSAVLVCSVSMSPVLAANTLEGVRKKEDTFVLSEPSNGNNNPKYMLAATGSAVVLNENMGDFQVKGGLSGKDYSYENNTLTIQSETPITISGTTTTDHIVIKKGITANITIKDLSINLTAQRPFDMTDASVILHLEGENTLQSANFNAALYCPKGAELVINGPGTLNVSTDNRGGSAAIGGDSINGTRIGWRDYGACGSITIHGGTINANNPLWVQDRTNPIGAAIGGYGGGPIIIDGGTIHALGNENTVGIGSLSSEFEGIFIRGGNITAETKGINMDDMGSSTAYGPAIGITSAYIDKSGNGPRIEITGGTVHAQGGFGTAGIGGGRSGEGGIILISGDADITAQGGFGAAGIGGGYAQNGSGNGGIITIEGNARVNARGGENAAGIGGGSPRNNSRPGQPVKDGHSGIITIAGNANVNATGGKNAPGIGSGGPDAAGSFDGAAIVEKIVIIDNVKVTATGGANSPTNIGPGKVSGDGNASPEERFIECIITAPGVMQKPRIEAQNSLIIDADGNYTVKGEVVLNKDFTVPLGKTLTIQDGARLIVPSGVNMNYSQGSIIGGTENIVNTGGTIHETKGDVYVLEVIGGTGGGSYQENTTLSISANIPLGKVFDHWIIKSGTGTITDAYAEKTTFIIGKQSTVIEAIFKEVTGEVIGVSISPQPIVIEKGKTQQFKAEVQTNGTDFDSIDKSVEWSVTGNKSNDTTISGSGLLTIASDETATALTVTAVSKQDNSKMATAAVTVTDKPLVQYQLTVVNGTGSGLYQQGETVHIQADSINGKTFNKWVISGSGTIKELKNSNTTFTVGTGDATITAVYTNRQNVIADSSSSDDSDNEEDNNVRSNTEASKQIISISEAIPSSEAYGEWKQEANGEWKFLHQNGTYAAKEWISVNGVWYLLKEDSTMATGWARVGDSWYYLDNSGQMATNWRQVDNTWYYLNSDGKMMTGWNKSGDVWYYLDTDGRMETGWKQLGQNWYFLHTDGGMVTGWIEQNGEWYYLKPDGACLVNAVTPDGYEVDETGKLK